MSKAYFAMETFGTLIVLVLLYANIFEIKQRSKKRKLFTQLLVVNFVVIAADAVTWLDADWGTMRTLFTFLLTITYVVPFVVQMVFSKYLYELISDKVNIGKLPFRILYFYSMCACTVVLVLCITGKMFEIREGKWYGGSAEIFYYLLYIVTLLFLSGVILANGKKLGLHDMLAVLSFCALPFICIIISISPIGLNLAISSMAIDMLVIYIMLETENENKLLYQNNVDELTGLFNRRAYEDNIMQYPDLPPEPDFVYASVDINGLKQVNDNLGHAAGDELIRGAAYCLKRTLGNYGRVYRTGGDEFVAIFFADEKRLNKVMEDLKNTALEWHGEIVDSISFSVGCAGKKEFANETVTEMAKIADKRMYQEKARYYATMGVDRRGQNEAHKALCALYTKILRVNLTDDSFAIVNINLEEKTEELGYSMQFSRWIEEFGKSGCVHPDDLKEYLAKTQLSYLQEYFKSQKTSLFLLYRRKYNDVFKQTMMEMIPTKDYTDDNQSLFLYVKNIDV